MPDDPTSMSRKSKKQHRSKDQPLRGPAQPPAQKKPYHRRDWPRKGDKNRKTTFAAVGEALTHWENYEGALALLFSEFVIPDLAMDRLAARRAYSSVRTFEARATMVEAAAEAYFQRFPDPKIFDQVDAICKSARNYCSRRNEIAHWQVGQHYAENTTETHPVIDNKLGYSLKPPFANSQHVDIFDKAKWAMTSVEIRYWTQEFIKLQQHAMATIMELFGKARSRHIEQALEREAERSTQMSQNSKSSHE